MWSQREDGRDTERARARARCADQSASARKHPGGGVQLQRDAGDGMQLQREASKDTRTREGRQTHRSATAFAGGGFGCGVFWWILGLPCKPLVQYPLEAPDELSRVITPTCSKGGVREADVRIANGRLPVRRVGAWCGRRRGSRVGVRRVTPSTRLAADFGAKRA